MKRTLVGLGLGCCLAVGGCADTLDHAYDSGVFVPLNVEQCAPPRRLGGDAYDLFVRRNRPNCMAYILDRKLREIFVKETEPWMFAAWLAVYGFRCDANRSTDPVEYDCRVRRTSRTRGILFGGAPPEEHVWQIVYRDVSPVMPSVRVKVWYPETEDEPK